MQAGLIVKWTQDEIDKLSRSLNSNKNKDDSKVEEEEEGGGPSAMTLEHLQGAFFLLGGGSFISSMIFLIETLIAFSCGKSNEDSNEVDE